MNKQLDDFFNSSIPKRWFILKIVCYSVLFLLCIALFFYALEKQTYNLQGYFLADTWLSFYRTSCVLILLQTVLNLIEKMIFRKPFVNKGIAINEQNKFKRFFLKLQTDQQTIVNLVATLFLLICFLITFFSIMAQQYHTLHFVEIHSSLYQPSKTCLFVLIGYIVLTLILKWIEYVKTLFFIA